MPRPNFLRAASVGPSSETARWIEPIADPWPDDTDPILVEPVAASPPPAAREAVPWREVRWIGFANGAPTAGAAIPAVRVDARSAPVLVHSAEPRESRADTMLPEPALGPTPPVLARDETSPRRSPEAQQRGGRDRRPTHPAQWRIARIGAGARRARQGAAASTIRLSSGFNTAASGIASGFGELRRCLAAGAGRVWRWSAAAASVGLIAVFAYQGGDHLASFATVTAKLAPAATPAAPAPSVGAAAAAAPAAAEPNAAPAVAVGPAARYLDRAKAGDPIAQYNIAALYVRGDGVTQDYFSAASWFREAALNGNPAAQFNLGVIYERGLGLPQNPGEAVLWYRRAADRGYADAQYNLALANAEGRGTPQDPAAAAHWYREAAGQGLVAAMVNLAILYEKGEGIDRSIPDAYAWYRAAARRGDAPAARRGSELFAQLAGPDKGKAVMLAAKVAGLLQESAAPLPAVAADKIAKPTLVPAVMKPGGWAARASAD